MVLTSRTASSSWRGICNKSVLDQIVISMTDEVQAKAQASEASRWTRDPRQRRSKGSCDYSCCERWEISKAMSTIIQRQLHDLQYVLGRQPSINIATK
ncbi:unnamed protein product [Peronospora farinosa]|uniref:Uncharacterized protein n=1 Tax=Peronospora farinosa TaxID=134698 RepID=A0ABN8CB71_9STRA|nr:unnamed protein product [Peronospora farinosa]